MLLRGDYRVPRLRRSTLGGQMNHGFRFAIAALLAATALVGGAASASAGPHGDFFVVDTQFRTAPSDIVEAGGAFADCTQVTDLVVGGEQIGPNKALFFGDKLVQCAEGTVTIHYNATFNFAGGKKTSGHWFVVDSTLPGVTSGFGTVRGDNSACEVANDSDGCILDTFAGTVE
jgi:hypothetical protein